MLIILNGSLFIYVDKNKPQGMVISVDRDFIEKIEGAHIFSFSDINDNSTFEKIKTLLNGRQVNSVVSDMVKIE